MYRTLSPGAIGVRANLTESIEYAKRGRFQGVEIGIEQAARFAEERSMDGLRNLFLEAGVRPGGWGLPVDWRGNQDSYDAGLARLDSLAGTGAALNCVRAMTWILPFSDDRPFEENFDFHVERFTPIARVLAEHGCSLGLEFIGPKTMRAPHKYEFVYSMGGMLELAAAIGPNVGLLLDCWHWYTSHGTLEDVARLRPEQVVYVHVNDAPTGIPIDEQIDNVRALPGETGVIDLTGFLRQLQAIGYEGPVTPEPFSAKLKTLGPDEAVETTGQSFLQAWERAGLTDGPR